MRTTVTINRKTAEVTFNVEDGQGTECQEKNAHYYERLRKEFGLPEVAATETEKPEMHETTCEEEKQYE